MVSWMTVVAIAQDIKRVIVNISKLVWNLNQSIKIPANVFTVFFIVADVVLA
jgi:hypothetical protein